MAPLSSNFVTTRWTRNYEQIQDLQFFPLSLFFVAYTNVARSWHVVLLHVHRLRSGWDNRRVSYRAYRRLLLPRNIVRASRWI